MAVYLNPSVYPPDGFYFVDSEGVRFDAENLVKLQKKIEEYRLRLNKTVGDVEREIHDQICSRYPSGCRDTEQTTWKPSTAPQPVPPLSVRVSAWLSRIYTALTRQKPEYVTRINADERAAVCKVCPKQKDWAGTCTGCSSSARRLAFAIRRGQETGYGNVLLGCSVLGEDTQTSIWLKNLQPSENPELPPNCWRRKRR